MGHAKTLHLRSEFECCPRCNSKLKYAYPLSRKNVYTAEGEVFLIHDGYICPVCEIVYRSAEADNLCLKHYRYGFDIIAEIGQARHSEHLTREELHQEIIEKYGVSISERNIQNLYEVYCMLLKISAPSALEQIKDQIRNQGGLVIALDGIQPQKGNETLYVIREVTTGTVLTAKAVQNSNTANMVKVLEEVAALGEKVLAVISDAQVSIRLAVKEVFPEALHQLCHYHYLENIARPYVAQDRAMQKEMKKKLRYLAPIERKLEKMPSVKATVIHGYLQSVRSLLTLKGKAPLNPPGIMIYEYLQAIKSSIETSLLHKEDDELNRLLAIVKECEAFSSDYHSLKLAQGWVIEISRILDPENYKDYSPEEGKLQAEEDLHFFVEELERGIKNHPEHKEMIKELKKLTNAHWEGLFNCFLYSQIPRTNNDLERFFRELKSNHRRATGRISWNDFVLRIGEFVVFDLRQEKHSLLERIKKVRYEDLVKVKTLWDKRIEKTRMQSRFKKDPQSYLKKLERLWKEQE